MNQWDVEEAAQMFRNHPALGPASQYLNDYMELINSCSDGWAHWNYGRKCAEKLQAMLEAAKMQRFRPDRNYVEPTYDDVKKAVAPIVRFMKKNPQDAFTGRKLPVLADAVQLRLL